MYHKDFKSIAVKYSRTTFDAIKPHLGERFSNQIDAESLSREPYFPRLLPYLLPVTMMMTFISSPIFTQINYALAQGAPTQALKIPSLSALIKKGQPYQGI